LEETADAITGIGKQLDDITACATESASNAERLREVTEETKMTAGWIGGNFSSGGCAPCVAVGNGAFTALWERYG
jgi:hypothetical protein